MTGLLLVEDEEAIKEKLLNNVAWADHGFDPVLSASNGLEALAALEQYPVRIMVTDVQMPKMNGIELIKEVKRRGYPMKIIVISGFAEFEYAQESIKLNVSDYLLKPFASRRLLETALRFQAELEREEAQRLETDQLRQQLAANRAALREKCFLDMINCQLAAEKIPAQLEYLGLSGIVGRQFQVAVLEIPENQLPEASEEWKYLLNLQLHQQLRQALDADAGEYYVINLHRNQLALISFEPDGHLPVRLEEVLTRVRSGLNCQIACGVGRRYGVLSDLAISYREACSALQFRYLYGLNQVFSINDFNLDGPSCQKIFFQLHRHPIFDNLKIGAERAVREELKGLFAEIRDTRLSPELAKLVAGNLILISYTTLNELGYNPAEIFGAGFPALLDMGRMGSLEELERLLESFFEKIHLHITGKRTSFNHRLVEEIRRYLDEHFAADITLSGMAARYKISPSYLSLLFTERTGQNFIDYLTERRIKKAKELLKHTDRKIYEIAAAVGYNDSFYFSNCFKKLIGISPTEYRENTARNDTER